MASRTDQPRQLDLRYLVLDGCRRVVTVDIFNVVANYASDRDAR